LHRSLPYQEISTRANLWLSHIDLQASAASP
jgi:hypothetical protein